MSELNSLFILFGVGLIAGFINVNAGGGSSLTLPALIFLGLDSALANGTNRVALLIQNISAVQSFKKEDYHQFGLSFKLALFTLPGAIAGAVLAVNIDDLLFKKILGVVMIGIVISMLFNKKRSENENNAKGIITWIGYLSMFGIGFYGGFLQVGVGFLLMASLNYLMKFDLIVTNMHKVFIILIYTIPALIIFAVTNNVNWLFGVTLGIGNAIGGWWGVKLSVKKGEKFIRFVLIAAILIMAVKLFSF